MITFIKLLGVDNIIFHQYLSLFFSVLPGSVKDQMDKVLDNGQSEFIVLDCLMSNVLFCKFDRTSNKALTHAWAHKPTTLYEGVYHVTREVYQRGVPCSIDGGHSPLFKVCYSKFARCSTLRCLINAPHPPPPMYYFLIRTKSF